MNPLMIKKHPYYELNEKNFMEGLQKVADLKKWNLEDWDAEVADVIIQYALFGELIYG